MFNDDYDDCDVDEDGFWTKDGVWTDVTLYGEVDLGIYDAGTPAFMATTSDPEILEADFWRGDFDADKVA